jgi:hypothetical protein
MRARRSFAREVAEELLRLLEERGIVMATDISSCRQEKEAQWHGDPASTNGSMGLTGTDSDGESSWSIREARELVATMRRKGRLAR